MGDFKLTVEVHEDFRCYYGFPRYCCADYRYRLVIDLSNLYNPKYLCVTYQVR